MQKLHPAGWDNAIRRALDLDGERAARYLGRGRFLIASASDPDRGAYDVRLNLSSRRPDVRCTCRAAQYGRPCWHGATALLMAGLVEPPADATAAAA